MAAVKELAVVAVATVVTHAELVQLKQERAWFRSFAARVGGKAETCQYTTKRACKPPKNVDFTDIIIRDVLLAGIVDMDIHRNVLSTRDILDQPVNEVISLVESKEMARHALPVSSAGISSSIHRGSPSVSCPPKDQRAVNAGCSSPSAASSVPCSCPACTMVPGRPSVLPLSVPPLTTLLWSNGCYDIWIINLQHVPSTTPPLHVGTTC